jgi:hypothetical protein
MPIINDAIAIARTGVEFAFAQGEDVRAPSLISDLCIQRQFDHALSNAQEGSWIRGEVYVRVASTRIRRLAYRPFAAHQQLLANGRIVSGRI